MYEASPVRRWMGAQEISGAHCWGVNAPIDSPSPSLVLTSPLTIAAALPHLLGFHPRESLVSLWLHQQEVLVVQRADLPDGDEGADTACYLRAYLTPAAGIGADEVVIVCVTSRSRLGESLIDAFSRECMVPVKARLLVHGSQVRAMDVSGGWQWVSSDARQHVHRRLTNTKRRVRRSRSEVVAEVEFDPDRVWKVSRDGLPAQPADILRFLVVGGFRTHAGCRRLRDIAITVEGRDLLVWWCARSTMDQRHELLVALMSCLQATPPGRSSHLACATAAVAWMVGDGVRANAALDRCLREAPDHLFAALVERAIGAALAPAVFAGFLREMNPTEFGVSQDTVDELLGGRYIDA